MIGDHPSRRRHGREGRRGIASPGSPSGVARALARLWLAVAILVGLTAAGHAVDVTTYHYDAARTGLNDHEKALSVANVRSARFARQLLVEFGGEQIDAQPLLVSAATFAAAGAAAQFPHDVAYVATEDDNVYAVDSVTGAILVRRNYGTPVATANLPGQCATSYKGVGITSTPVIDTAAGVMYVMTYTWESGAAVYRLHELNLADLTDRVPSVVVAASQTLSDGTLTTFNAGSQRQRPALLLSYGNIYAAFGSFCDLSSNLSRGWLLGWQKGTLAPLRRAMLLDRETAAQAGSGLNNGGRVIYFLSAIWMSGFGPAADGTGSIYFETGNSNANRADNLPESAVKVSKDLGTIVDYFTPANFAYLDSQDIDFGSGGIMVAPLTSSGAALAFGAAKDGRMFAFDRTDMGGFVANGPDRPASVNIGPCWCGPSYFVGADGRPRIVSSGGTLIQTWSMPTTATSPMAREAAALPLPLAQDASVMTSVSSNGTAADSAIIWAVSHDVGGLVYLEAVDATSSNNELVQLKYLSAGTWAFANVNANIVPVVANGKVYVASFNTLEVFGLSP